MRRFCVAVTAVLLAGSTGGVLAQRSAPAGARLALTVDSIMRGPDLVGWPPASLRWSGDSERLYFEWRKPGEAEPSTYVVGREGGQPRKLSDDETRNAPAADGRWDRAKRRVVFADAGDIVMIDGARRVQITRTTGAESNPRWARNDTHVTYVRDGNLFVLPVENAGNAASLVTQLTDVAPKRAEPKLSDSQKFIKEEEQKLLEYLREQAEQKKRAEEK